MAEQMTEAANTKKTKTTYNKSVRLMREHAAKAGLLEPPLTPRSPKRGWRATERDQVVTEWAEWTRLTLAKAHLDGRSAHWLQRAVVGLQWWLENQLGTSIQLKAIDPRIGRMVKGVKLLKTNKKPAGGAAVGKRHAMPMSAVAEILERADEAWHGSSVKQKRRWVAVATSALLQLYGGLRLGEVLALTRGDITEENGHVCVHIAKSKMDQLGHGATVEAAPINVAEAHKLLGGHKTASSQARAHAALIASLTTWLRRQKLMEDRRYGTAAGASGGPAALVFTRCEDGRAQRRQAGRVETRREAMPEHSYMRLHTGVQQAIGVPLNERGTHAYRRALAVALGTEREEELTLRLKSAGRWSSTEVAKHYAASDAGRVAKAGQRVAAVLCDALLDAMEGQ